MGQHPRNGGDAAIPGPDGFVGMAVVAGTPEHCLHRGWGGNVTLHRRVCSVDRDELDDDQHSQYRESHSDTPFLHPTFLPALHDVSGTVYARRSTGPLSRNATALCAVSAEFL